MAGSSVQALDEAGQTSAREGDRKAWNLPGARPLARPIAHGARENEDDTARGEAPDGSTCQRPRRRERRS